MHRRRCTHTPPVRRQSSHPSLDGVTSSTVPRCVQVSAIPRVWHACDCMLPVAAMPETHFVRSGDVDLAYQVFGDGPRNLLALAGWVSHLEVIWELPEFARFLERLGEIGRVVMYDKRGSGMSDRPPGMWPLEVHAAGARAVLDAAGMDTVSCIGWVDAVAVLVAFAATWPERVDALVLGSFLAQPSEMVSPDVRAAFAESTVEGWGEARTVALMVPSVAQDERV